MKKKINVVWYLCLLLALILNGCAVGRTLSYTAAKTSIQANAGFTYSIATHDQREEVLDGSQKETFVGYMRSGVGIAYPIVTESGRNFSDDFSLVIMNSLNDSAAGGQTVQTRSFESEEEILKQLFATQSDRILLFKVVIWRTDSKPIGMEYGTDVIWDISLDIYNKNGDWIASNRIEGIDPGLDLAMAGSIKRTQDIVNKELKEKIDQLLHAPSIQRALMQ